MTQAQAIAISERFYERMHVGTHVYFDKYLQTWAVRLDARGPMGAYHLVDYASAVKTLERL